MAESVVIHIDGSGARMFYSDRARRDLGAVLSAVRRLTHVEFDGGRGDWTVSLAATGEILTRNVSRDVCLAWERDNAAELLRLHAKHST